MHARLWELVIFLVLLVGVHGQGTSLQVSNTLGSNMVLQREPVQAKVWGWVNPSETVSVDFNNQQIEASVTANGTWVASLPATAAGGPYTIVVSSSDGGKVVLSNVLFGEVWICGGQSNMQFTVAQAFNATAEIQAANNYPNIRIMTVGQSFYSPVPIDNLHTIFMNWSVASAQTVGFGEWNAMSAVCWFTGRDLYDNLQVPIGLISSNWGGTVIQAWSPPVALDSCNVTTSQPGNEANSVLYNAMIIPFQNYQIAGALWYQGEQNAGQNASVLYACLFPAMINSWRSLWGYDFPFFFVQLAPYGTPGPSWPETRTSQLTALSLPKVGYASAVDLGDPTSPFGDVHPRDKQDVGKRLSSAVRNIAYGQTTIIWEGPTLNTIGVMESGGSTFINVTFNNPAPGGLVYVNQTYPPPTIIPATECANWQVQTSSGTWVAASEGTIQGNSVVITAEGLTGISGISYAFASWPITTLFSSLGLPAIPFQTIFKH